MSDPQNLVLELLRDLRSEIAEMKSELKSDLADVRSEMHSLRADVASDLMTVEKALGNQIVGLRRAVIEYHSSVIGHGVIFSELEERVRRLEQKAGIPPQTGTDAETADGEGSIG